MPRPSSTQQRKGATDDGIPYVIEFAFGLHQSGSTPGSTLPAAAVMRGAPVPRKFITGANWSVGISNPFRTFGTTGEGLESTLTKVRANAREPVICALHLRASGLRAYPIRRPREELDHPHRQRRATR